MPLLLATDLGTTKITAVAVDAVSGALIACHTLPNDAETTSPSDKARGYSEWDAQCIVEIGYACLRGVVALLGSRLVEVAGIGITGQQHGVVLVDDALQPLTAFINWQDRRAQQIIPDSRQTYVQKAIELVGPGAPSRSGCRLAAGYMGVTLFWMKETNVLSERGAAYFIMDYFGSRLTGTRRVTDATCGASSGLFNVAKDDWDADSLGALGLSRHIFPEVRTSGSPLGGLISEAAAKTGLPQALPVFVGIGDNQASFIGSVGNQAGTVLVNVGTGAQVAAFSERFAWDPLLETRPFPRGGYLLVSAGLCGGASYATLERFFHQVQDQIFGQKQKDSLFALLNGLAAGVPPGADGLCCEPYFAGTRANPSLRGAWTGVSVENFTPAHMARALLEGMTRSFREGYDLLTRVTGQHCCRLVGAGNGLRENAVLAGLVSEAFGMPLTLSRHSEEAAFGAALVAGIGAGVFADLAQANEFRDAKSS